MFIVQQLPGINVYFRLHMELYLQCRLKGKAWGAKQDDQLGRRGPQIKEENFVKILVSIKIPAKVIVISSFYITIRMIVLKQTTICLHLNAWNRQETKWKHKTVLWIMFSLKDLLWAGNLVFQNSGHIYIRQFLISVLNGVYQRSTMCLFTYVYFLKRWIRILTFLDINIGMHVIQTWTPF